MLFYNIKQCLRLSNAAGLHPEKRNSKLQWLLYSLISGGALGIVYLAVLLLVYKEDALTIANYTEAFSGMSMVIHGIQRSLGLFFNRKNLSNLIDNMRTRFWKVEEVQLTDDDKLYYQSSYRQIRIAFHVFIFFCTINSSCACFQTFFFEDDILAFICYRPKWMSFYTLWLIQAFVMVFAIIVPIVCLDTLLMTIVTLTQIQFRLLNKEIENVFNVKSRNDGNYLRGRIRRVIEHHIFLLEYSENINKTFSGSILTYMALIVLSMCVEMYNLSSGSDIAVFLRAVFYVNVALVGLIVYYCWPAQKLTNEANKIRESAYFSEWYEYPMHSKAMLMMMTRGQREVIITGGGLVNINLETSLSTIKTMVSYCMFLQTMGDK